jgi:hypothetical protein
MSIKCIITKKQNSFKNDIFSLASMIGLQNFAQYK